VLSRIAPPAAVCLLLLAACTPPDDTPPAPSPPYTDQQHQQVVDAFTRYVGAGNLAAQASDPHHPWLSEHDYGPHAAAQPGAPTPGVGLLARIAANDRAGHVYAAGVKLLHTRILTWEPPYATAQACVDVTGFVVVDRTTGEPVGEPLPPGDTGMRIAAARLQLTHVDTDQWTVIASDVFDLRGPRPYMPQPDDYPGGCPTLG
jgi:hypothetical protein